MSKKLNLKKINRKKDCKLKLIKKINLIKINGWEEVIKALSFLTFD